LPVTENTKMNETLYPFLKDVSLPSSEKEISVIGDHSTFDQDRTQLSSLTQTEVSAS
jgi:hypothetical protein